MGKLDSQGIYQYDEDDNASLVSTLLNLLASSVSTAVTGIRSRLTTLEKAAPIPVANARYLRDATGVASGQVLGIGTLKLQEDRSSSSAPTLFTPIAHGVQVKRRGIYLLTINVSATAAFNGRFFFDVAVDSGGTDNYRMPASPMGEETLSLPLELIVPADDTKVTFGMFHSTGQARTTSLRMDITRLGALT